MKGDETPCLALGLTWRVCAVLDQGVGLRLVDRAGALLPTPVEAEGSARERAQARVSELEEEIRRLKGG